MMNPWVILGVVVAALALATGAYFFGEDVGTTAANLVWQTKYNKDLSAANKKITDLNKKNLDLERKHAEALVTISTDFQRRLANAKRTADKDAAAARSGAVVLYDPATGQCTGGSTATKTGTGPGGRNATPCARLSREATEFLLGLANDADAVASQLQSCQQVIIADRSMVQ